MRSGMMSLRWVLAITLFGLTAGLHVHPNGTSVPVPQTSFDKQEYEEGDTATLVCTVDLNLNSSQLDKLEFRWKFSAFEFITITDWSNLVYFDTQGHFSGVSLERQGEFLIYKLTITNVNRYHTADDSFSCFTALENGNGAGSLIGMEVNWNPPSTQCSSGVPSADEVMIDCSTLDTDPGSSATGSLTLWKNNEQLQVDDTVTSLPNGTQYDLSYTTETSGKDMYICRYFGTGGFQEYKSNCTAITGTSAASCHHLQSMTVVGLPILIMYWILLLD